MVIAIHILHRQQGDQKSRDQMRTTRLLLLYVLFFLQHVPVIWKAAKPKHVTNKPEYVIAKLATKAIHVSKVNKYNNYQLYKSMFR